MIVLALVEPAPAAVAPLRDHRRIQLAVEHGAAVATDQSPRQATDQLALRHVDRDDGVEPVAAPVEQLAQGTRLRDGAREAVEDEAGRTVRPGEPLRDE